MTPLEASKLVDKLTPAFVKLTLVRLLEWQATHPMKTGKPRTLINIAWYLKCMKYEEFPRESKRPDAVANRQKIAALVGGIGR